MIAVRTVHQGVKGRMSINTRSFSMANLFYESLCQVVVMPLGYIREIFLDSAYIFYIIPYKLTREPNNLNSNHPS